jgi:hypothetical protein
LKRILRVFSTFLAVNIIIFGSGAEDPISATLISIAQQMAIIEHNFGLLSVDNTANINILLKIVIDLIKTFHYVHTASV